MQSPKKSYIFQFRLKKKKKKDVKLKEYSVIFTTSFYGMNQKI